MLGAIFDTTALRAARLALDGLAQRQQVIGGNVANIDTPGYQRRSVTFEDALARLVTAEGDDAGATQLAVTDRQHLQPGSGRGSWAGVAERDVIAARNDGNTVSIDEEMVLLAETQLRYEALTQSLGRRLGTLRSAIRG